jgi:hypothetical protein
MVLRSPSAAISLFIAPLFLTGCAAAWIVEPSTSVQTLVRDLSLQGYVCNAGMSSITCQQEDPYEVPQSSLCDAERCVERAPKYLVSHYRIGQSGSGAPLIDHKMIEVDKPASGAPPRVHVGHSLNSPAANSPQ